MKPVLAKTILKNAKKRFDESGMTLEELAQKMGIKSATARQSAYQLFRSADPQISTIEKLAHALGVGVKDLF